MQERIIYSPKLRIPLFKVIKDGDENLVQYYKKTSSAPKTEIVRTTRMAIYIVSHTEMPEADGQMLRSPTEDIPIGIIKHKKGVCYIEVKRQKSIESLRLTSYLSLLLEPPKAS